ncbi:MAG: MotA/TolQ/ExbB proton channel family protein [Pirellulales bacterium]|nr:MotA/TolQ/ExbB proton channel family protein [Pirellulales bacterium]
MHSSGSLRVNCGRRLAPFALAALVGLGWNLSAADWARAQEGDAAGADAAAAAPAADASIKDAAAASTPPPQVNYLTWIVDAMGWHYTIAFLAISFALVALFVMNILAARRENVVPSALVEGFEQHLNNKQYQEAYDLAKVDESFLGHILSAGLARVSGGYSEAIEAMQEVGEEENLRMEQRLGYLALIGTISPMIGLLGTVEGMVQSFMVIANTATGAPDPQELAKGISKALFTTLVGLYLAIPALMAYHIIRNRVSRLVLEVGVVSEGMMRRFRKPGDMKKTDA